MKHADPDRPIVYDSGSSFETKRPINEDELEQDLINVQHQIRLTVTASSPFKRLPVLILMCRTEQSTEYSNNSSLQCNQ